METTKESWVYNHGDGSLTDISSLKQMPHDATRAKEFLRLTGKTMVPDTVHQILHLRTSRATLGRKMREAAQRGELVRSYYVNERGTKICQYSFNQDYKEGK